MPSQSMLRAAQGSLRNAGPGEGAGAQIRAACFRRNRGDRSVAVRTAMTSARVPASVQGSRRSACSVARMARRTAGSSVGAVASTRATSSAHSRCSRVGIGVAVESTFGLWSRERGSASAIVRSPTWPAPHWLVSRRPRVDYAPQTADQVAWSRVSSATSTGTASFGGSASVVASPRCSARKGLR